MKPALVTLALLALAVLPAGCSTFGPRSIPRARLECSLAFGPSREEQILLNVVRGYKSTLHAVSVVLRALETGSSGQLPVLTIPAG